ncbi:MAG: hypothetical protein SFV18_15305 [Bryobacteraceae bacterium]|nr:hypothetical protein [Bryobacteraceae bacterium]
MTAHFKTEQWIDFARGLASPVLRAEIEEHLARGCEDCRVESARHSLLWDVGRNEVEVPDAVVARALAIAPAPAKPGWRDIVAALVFDSFASPLAAGVRGPGAARMMHFSGGGLEIDVAAEPLPAGALRLMGQIEGSGAASARVRLTAGGEVMDSAVANGFGEFELHGVGHPELVLNIGTALGEGAIRVPLPKLIEE